MPNKAFDEAAALNQFKNEYFKIYCHGNIGPDFLTKPFDEVLSEAHKNQSTKRLGKVILSIINTLLFVFFTIVI